MSRYFLICRHLLILLVLSVNPCTGFITNKHNNCISQLNIADRAAHSRLPLLTTEQSPRRIACHLYKHRQNTPYSINGKRATSSLSLAADDERLPFIVERLPKQANVKIFQEISNMCITAFFNDEDDTSPSLWKEWQLKSLRKMQTSDLNRRRARESDTNMMFVARRVVPVKESMATEISKTTPLLLDLSDVQNRDVLENSLPTSTNGVNGNQNGRSVAKLSLNGDNASTTDYVRGDLLGFVEVTLRPYGLGDYATTQEDEKQQKKAKVSKSDVIRFRKSNFNSKRPILTNLSVVKYARRSGVGSALLQECERAVSDEWNQNEIILEVEDDNVRAQKFYEKRGYVTLFQDPASRRYNVDGFWLQQLRCTRLIMRKDLSVTTAVAEDVQSTLDKGMQALKRFFSAR